MITEQAMMNREVELVAGLCDRWRDRALTLAAYD